jgi:osmoprotectant transport system permease protein
VDYSGTIWATIMHREPGPSREAVLEGVTRFLRDEHGIGVAGALGFENTYALAMRRDEARARGVARISELTPHAPRLTIGSDYEFFARPEWAAVRRAYALAFRDLRTMDPALMYQAVAAGDVDVITAFSTDGRIDAYDLAVLDDDRAAIPPYDAIMLVSPRLARDRPDAVAALSLLTGAIDNESMRRMNLAVDERGERPEAVAQGLLKELSGG